ncbi:hypothetical protein DFS34DRAFT_601197 [Phlyctochytrium arcticum]|nr:hypothetical protein DFS34DRAFT_601197 [Phlyctochytrium arcticum]
MEQVEWGDWLASSLAGLGIEDETFSEYIVQLCLEDSIEEEERKDVITEFLAESANEPVDDLVTELLKKNAESKVKKQKEMLEERVRALAAQRSRDLEALKSDTHDDNHTKSKQELSAEEQAMRSYLLSQYGYEAEGDESENPSQPPSLVKGKVSSKDKRAGPGDPLLERNVNAETVRLQEQAKKLAAQTEHQRQQVQLKAMQEKQKAEREKEKKRTVKKEKRRM